MLNPILRLVLPLILTISVVVSQSYAKLGDAEKDVVEQNRPRAESTSSFQADPRLKVYVFLYPKGYYSIGVVDGTVEIETYAVFDNYDFPKSLISNELAKYGDSWTEIYPNVANTKRFVTDNGEVFAVIGEMKELSVKKAITIFTKEFIEHENKTTL
jgi:hypothetical protein